MQRLQVSDFEMATEHFITIHTCQHDYDNSWSALYDKIKLFLSQIIDVWTCYPHVHNVFRVFWPWRRLPSSAGSNSRRDRSHRKTYVLHSSWLSADDSVHSRTSKSVLMRTWSYQTRDYFTIPRKQCGPAYLKRIFHTVK